MNNNDSELLDRIRDLTLAVDCLERENTNYAEKVRLLMSDVAHKSLPEIRLRDERIAELESLYKRLSTTTGTMTCVCHFTRRDCNNPCKGECGCKYCHDNYQDFLSTE